MFIIYSSDHCVEFRPWLAYLTFPAIIAASFVLAVQGPIPEAREMMFLNMCAISGLVVFAYMIGTFFILWTFGKAACSKIGNIMYILTLVLVIASGQGIIFISSENSIWLLSWLVHSLAGLFLVFCPTSEVDCFFYIPPFRGFSMNSLLAVLSWLAIDIIFCLCLGWIVPLFLHLLSFLFGILWGSLLLRIPYISDGIGDLTLWKWFKGESLGEDLSWKESWSEKKKAKEKLDQEKLEEDLLLKKKEKHVVSTLSTEKEQQTVSVLCQCGHVLHAPATFEGKRAKCPHCSHIIHIPKSDN